MILYELDYREEEVEGLYKMLIDQPAIISFFKLLFSITTHYKYYFQDNWIEYNVFAWADRVVPTEEGLIKTSVGACLVLIVYIWFMIIWAVFWTTIVMKNYRTLRNEAPIKLLKLG